jgi:hypothetical protein
MGYTWLQVRDLATESLALFKWQHSNFWWVPQAGSTIDIDKSFPSAAPEVH